MSIAINEPKISANGTPPSTDVADLIARLAAAGPTIIAARDAARAHEAAVLDASLAEAWAEANAALNLPAWMEKYLDVPEAQEHPFSSTHRTLALPDCAPIGIYRDGSYGSWQSALCQAYWAEDAKWDDESDEWHPVYRTGNEFSLDQIAAAIYQARSNGKTHAYTMAEIAMLNSEGRKPNSPAYAAEPDAPNTVAQAGELLLRHGHGNANTLVVG